MQAPTNHLAVPSKLGGARIVLLAEEGRRRQALLAIRGTVDGAKKTTGGDEINLPSKHELVKSTEFRGLRLQNRQFLRRGGQRTHRLASLTPRHVAP